MAVGAIALRRVMGDRLGIADVAIYVIDPVTGDMTDLKASFSEDATLTTIAPKIMDGAAVGQLAGRRQCLC